MKCSKCNKKEANSIIRTLDVCSHCYNLIKIDNKKRISQGVDIPKSFMLYKK